jgi:uncharacterized protein YegP (UPF0339 family)
MGKTIRFMAVLLALAVLAGGAGLHHATAQVKDKPAKDAKVQPKDKKVSTAATATFELYKDNGGKYRFRIRDDEGTLLAISGKGYETKADCQRVIDTIKRDVAKAKVDDQSK